jgi:hypothetical protein
VRILFEEPMGSPSRKVRAAVTRADGQGGRSEVLEVRDGVAEIALEAGRWTLHVGSPLSPTARPDEWFVPETRTVSVTAGATTPAGAPVGEPVAGGLVGFPEALGIPRASMGALDVTCSRDGDSVDRRTRVPFDRASDDVLWPPLPAGAWTLDVRVPGAAPVRLRAEVVAGTIANAER